MSVFQKKGTITNYKLLSLIKTNLHYYTDVLGFSDPITLLLYLFLCTKDIQAIYMWTGKEKNYKKAQKMRGHNSVYLYHL